jgi:hypothetical protein
LKKLPQNIEDETMNRIAVELDEKLKSLDERRADALVRKVREAIEQADAIDTGFVNPDIDPMLGVENGWPVGYFASTAGMFADEPFERPDQGEMPEAKTW